MRCLAAALLHWDTHHCDLTSRPMIVETIFHDALRSCTSPYVTSRGVGFIFSLFCKGLRKIHDDRQPVGGIPATNRPMRDWAEHHCVKSLRAITPTSTSSHCCRHYPREAIGLTSPAFSISGLRNCVHSSYLWKRATENCHALGHGEEGDTQVGLACAARCHQIDVVLYLPDVSLSSSVMESA
ncbi:hypothetical protein F4808DRAFT_442886 [Astrocystis sublimbata]|nr:hypothetical protein F4808DRAFT_442886 [Astrocystis sublimbata]